MNIYIYIKLLKCYKFRYYKEGKLTKYILFSMFHSINTHKYGHAVRENIT